MAFGLAGYRLMRTRQLRAQYPWLIAAGGAKKVPRV